jgi:competence protein ComEC
MMASAQTPDILITRDGRHAAIMGESAQPLFLRDTSSSYARDNLLELAGTDAEVIALSDWPDARCSGEFCVLNLLRGERNWTLLMARSNNLVSERELAAACDQADIVIADRYFPRSCKPRYLLADKRFLDRRGGLSLHLSTEEPAIRSVSDYQGSHGWWRGADQAPR